MMLSLYIDMAYCLPDKNASENMSFHALLCMFHPMSWFYGSLRFSFQTGIILFPVESLGEMGAFPYIISLGDSFIV